MKYIEVDRPGGYDSLVIKERNATQYSDKEYVISVKAIGINYADIIAREGYYTAAKGKYPLILGFEYSGIITSKGRKAKKYRIGDKICGYTLFGAYTTEIAASEANIRKIPAGWSFAESAGLLVANLTAYHGLNNVAHAKPGEVIVVHSAAGGVGTSLLQQSKLLGCRVIAVVGSLDKVSVAEQYGAHHVIVRDQHLWKNIDNATPDGIDIIFDANGMTTPKPGYRRLNLGGRLVIYGFAELFPRGKRPWLPILAAKSFRIPKFSIRNMTSTNRSIMGLNLAFLVNKSDLVRPAFDFVVQNAASGRIKKPIVKEFDFLEVAQAHQELESGKSIGKVVMIVGS